MTDEEKIAYVKECHNANMTRREMGTKIGIGPEIIDRWICRWGLSRRSLGLVPLGGPDKKQHDTPLEMKMTEDEIAALFAGKRYDSLAIKSSGTTRVIPHRGEIPFTVSSMAF